MESPKRSWRGFKLSKNLISALKKAAYVLVPALLAELATNNLLTTGVVGIISPAILNAIEYWLKEYK